ncbi:MAG: hypothetical protein ACK4S4_11745 [Pyrinomonadaceae bacterium]
MNLGFEPGFDRAVRGHQLFEKIEPARRERKAVLLLEVCRNAFRIEDAVLRKLRPVLIRREDEVVRIFGPLVSDMALGRAAVSVGAEYVRQDHFVASRRKRIVEQPHVSRLARTVFAVNDGQVRADLYGLFEGEGVDVRDVLDRYKLQSNVGVLFGRGRAVERDGGAVGDGGEPLVLFEVLVRLGDQGVVHRGTFKNAVPKILKPIRLGLQPFDDLIFQFLVGHISTRDPIANAPCAGATPVTCETHIQWSGVMTSRPRGGDRD